MPSACPPWRVMMRSASYLMGQIKKHTWKNNNINNEEITASLKTGAIFYARLSFHQAQRQPGVGHSVVSLCNQHTVTPYSSFIQIYVRLSRYSSTYSCNGMCLIMLYHIGFVSTAVVDAFLKYSHILDCSYAMLRITWDGVLKKYCRPFFITYSD